MVQLSRSDFPETVDCLLRSTVFLYSEEDKTSGTGFFSSATHNGKRYYFLISAKHIFADKEKISVKIIRDIKNQKNILTTDFHLDLLDGKDEPLWFTIWDQKKEIDVAILPANDLVKAIAEFDRKNEIQGGLFFFDLSTFADNSIIAQERISAGADVLFPGYPLGYIGKTPYPILRSGVIATPPERDFNLLSRIRGKYEPVFLIDAQFFPGSSGSPVFWPISPIRLNVETNQIEHRVDSKINSAFIFLGVGTAFFPYSGSIIGAPLGTFYKENSGLGIVYRAQVIKSLIMNYILNEDSKTT